MEDVFCFWCGGVASFRFKSGRYCCSKSASSCPVMIKKNSDTHIGKCPKWKNGHPRGMLGKIPYSFGKTYVEIFGIERAKTISESIGLRLKGKSTGVCPSFSMELERRERIRSSINKRYENGWMPKAGRCKKIKYTSSICGDVLLDGSWELLFAEFLDTTKLKWNRNKQRFPYYFDGKNRNYTPDFYIDDLGVFVEVKGYVTGKDIAKWSQFPVGSWLIVIGKKEINGIKHGTYCMSNFKEACANGKQRVC